MIYGQDDLPLSKTEIKRLHAKTKHLSKVKQTAFWEGVFRWFRGEFYE